MPRKNVRLLGGRPLIAHTIRHAGDTPQVGRVVVSTDDDEIAAIATAEGATVVPRPPGISHDKASSESALEHVLQTLKEQEGYRPDLVAFLQCTAPFRAPDDLSRAIDQLVSAGGDSLLSVSPTHRFLWQVGADGAPAAVNYDPLHRPRRQDMVPQFVENGSFYVFRPWVLRTLGNRLGGRILLHEMDERAAIDIDSEADFAIAEALWSFRNARVERQPGGG